MLREADPLLSTQVNTKTTINAAARTLSTAKVMTGCDSFTEIPSSPECRLRDIRNKALTADAVSGTKPTAGTGCCARTPWLMQRGNAGINARTEIVRNVVHGFLLEYEPSIESESSAIFLQN